MGGQIQEVIKPSIEEIYARLIELGRNAKIPNPHSVWVVESQDSFRYDNRSELDHICYLIPVLHLELFPFSVYRLQSASIVFFAYKDYDAAISEANRRIKSHS